MIVTTCFGLLRPSSGFHLKYGGTFKFVYGALTSVYNSKMSHPIAYIHTMGMAHFRIMNASQSSIHKFESTTILSDENLMMAAIGPNM